MDQSRFKLNQIKTEQFAIIDQSYNDKEGQVSLIFDVDLNLNPKDRTVKSSVKFQFSQANRPFIIIEVSCQFKISDNEFLNLIQETSVIFERETVTELADFVVKTTRGILHAKTESTIFNQFRIPQIDLTNTIQGSLAFEIM